MAEKSPVIENRQQLVSYIASGEKPADRWRIGTEHEKFVYCNRSYTPLPYAGERSIRTLLEGLQQFGWQPKYEGENLIALSKDGASVTLEPAGQFELSGAPLETLHQTCKEVSDHMREVKSIAQPLDIGLIGLGFDPVHTRDEMPIMPKGRYVIMRRYMPTVGSMGLDMMLRTCTVQVNLDYASEADMVKKFRASLALQPVATALFANSPFKEGKLNGFKSWRSHVWTDTDPARCGMLGFVFEDGFGYERYVDYLLDVPMYFVYRDGKYIDAAGQSFRDFMVGKLPALPGEQATMADFEDHLTTAFPEVRLKKYLEMRGADGGPGARLCALPALWTGLLYDNGALDAAWDLVKDWSMEERENLRANVPRDALATRFRGGTVRDVAAQVLEIAGAGLKARNRQNSMGATEEGFLAPLWASAHSGKTPADILIERFELDWDGDASRVYEEFSY